VWGRWIQDEHGRYRTDVDAIHDYDAFRKSINKHEKTKYKIRWKSWFKNLKKMLADLLRQNRITQREADKAMEEFLRDHPNPDPEPETVTAIQDVEQRTLVPERESVEVER
jgi:hypothetical protein